MRVLLSAYACEPNRGSEPGVGWNWLVQIAERGHKVIVITRKNNKEVIENYNYKNENIQYIFFDFPDSIIFIKKIIGVHLYYLLWQIGIYFKVKKRLHILKPDIIHHITFVAIRKYSFLCFLGIPFYYGPLGGGESCPDVLLKGLPLIDLLKEKLRKVLNSIIKWNPISYSIFNHSRKIFTTTTESASYLPDSFKSKIHSLPAIGVTNEINKLKKEAKTGKLKILYVGNFIYLKGLQIVFDALYLLKCQGIDFSFTIVGKGGFKKFLKNKEKKLNLEENIKWINWLPQEELKELYQSNDLFLFSSLHDSGGMVLLEAISNGLPVMSFNLGGAGFFNNDEIGWIINVNKKSYNEVVEEMSNRLLNLTKNTNEIALKSQKCYEESVNYSWKLTVKRVYKIIEEDYKDLKSKLSLAEDLNPNKVQKYNRIIIAYACEDSGSEPGVGYYWSKAIATICKDEKILLITRKNNNVSTVVNNTNLFSLGIDLPSRILVIKKFLGIRIYYFIWQFLVFLHLLFNIRKYKGCVIHQLTFTPLYYPPIFFLLPFKFIWGPLGGGEFFPLSYLSALKKRDAVKEIFRIIIRNSIYINPLFYLGCAKSIKIICSSPDSARMIPSFYKHKVELELMVFDKDKNFVNSTPEKNIIIANRLIDWKMTHLFVEAFSEYIAKNNTDYKLIIVGDGPYYSKIKPFIDNVNIIHFKRFKQREDMLNVLRNASLFVSTSLHDSGSASLLEAISYGLPFLATKTGAHNVYLDKGIGFGFELEDFNLDKEKIKSILFKILNDKSILIEESKKVVECYRDYFSEKAKIIRVKNLIDIKTNL
ncbi:glycosyltransferase family 4 protein [Flavobacterium luteum]|uniref:Glycosyltransferase n=1 Tax=Flavobacterium luteum TaxID=2026654 RepID=A0A7J5ADY2_9FLAO|nr:glycosyltransferase [Flavobacterium luteum]KAB1155791.1 glycosyltransferase [Flavobacterium luteum]